MVASKEKDEVYLLWRDSTEYTWLQSKGRVWGGLLAVALCAFLIAALWPMAAHSSTDSNWKTELFAFLALLGAFASYVLVATSFRWAASRRAYYDRIKVAKSRAVDAAVGELKESPSLENLLVLNRRQLDDYHLSSMHQQSIAFRNAQIAAAIGFAVLVAGAVLSVQQSNTAAQYVTAGLSALGAALSTYVASVFFGSYKDTSDEMRAYYREPFGTHQILMIERLADLQGPERDELRREIVCRLLNAVHPFEGMTAAGPTRPTPRGNQAD